MRKVFKVRERSIRARIAAFILRTNNVAFVMGSTIYLWNASREDLLRNKRWLRHELTHIRQFHQYGYFRFIGLYLCEWIKNGYYRNRFEVEARAHEQDEMENDYEMA